MFNNKHFSNFLKLCSVLPALAIMPAMAETSNPVDEALGNDSEKYFGPEIVLTDDIAQAKGHSLKGNSELTIDFGGYTYSAYGEPAGSTGTKNQLFQFKKQEDNLASDGSTVVLKNGTLNVSENAIGEFKMLIQNYSKLTLDNMVLDGSNLSNKVVPYPYTISNNNATVNINNSTIIAKAGGAALDVYYYNEGKYTTPADVTLNNSNIQGKIEIGGDGDFNGSQAVLTLVGANTIVGDIENAGIVNINTTDDATSTFTGRISNTGVLNAKNSMFKDSVATDDGGAIYNAGQMELGGTFEENSAGQRGGAIYNAQNAKLTIADGTTFKNNKTTDEAYAFGGAIFNAGELKIDDNVTFEGNNAQRAAAIYNYGATDATLTIGNNVTFKNNKNTFGDVKGMSGGAMITAAQTSIGDNALFDGNVSNWGGAAIAIQANKDLGTGTDQNVIVTIGKNAKFSNNTVLKGGIPSGNDGIVDMDEDIAAYGTASLTIGEGAEFSNNKSVSLAIRNTNSTATLNGAVFKDNQGYDVAGAIYNEGITNLNGTFVFQNNKVGNVLNDIDNKGTLNISGDLTMDGGITGDGAIKFAKNSVLNVDLFNGVVLQASAITLEDNVLLGLDAIENGTEAKDYTFADVTTWTGDFVLKDALTSNALYNISTTKGVLSITRKSAAEQTANLEKAGLDSTAAKTIAAISGVKTMGNEQVDALFTELTIAAQAGDADAIAKINEVAKAINPESESVVQSAAVSTQNTINHLTAGRMALGRNGGDVDLTAGGVWVQGLYNRAKNADKFSANTRGISAGIDGTINNDIMVGIGYAFGHSDVDAQTRDTDIDSHSVFLYGQYKPSAWYANATLNYTTSKYDEKGNAIVPVDADYRANTFGANVATGYDLSFGLTPELGLRYMHVKTNAYDNSLGMHVDSNDTDFLTGIAGARYGFDIMASDEFLIRPELSAAAKYDMLSDENTATVALPNVNAYTLDGERLNRFGGEFGAGLTMSYYGFDLSLTYSIDVRKDYTSQTGMAKFRYNF